MVKAGRFAIGRRARRRGGVLAVAAVLAALVAASVETTPAEAAVPSGFVEQIVWGGLKEPTTLLFAPDGRVFVGEKRGTIQMFDSVTDTTPTQIADLRTEVENFWDRGLIAVALDPAFPTRPYLYVTYTYDAPIGGTAPTWGTGGDSDPCPNPPGATTDGCVVSAKLARLTLTGTTTTKTDLINDWCMQYPSHTIGDIAFGPDGALYVSGGDGASFDFSDYGQAGTPKNPCGDPPGGVGGAMSAPTAEGGSFRSQDVRTTGDPTGLDGTIIRIDPDTGAGLAGNPFAASSDANARRIIGYGMRNPFRFTFRPGTSEIWFGDVGAGTWEEINRLTSFTTAPNYGWPCYEGPNPSGGFANAGFDLCTSLYSQNNDTKPYFSFLHGSPLGANDNCPVQGGSSISGLAFNGDNGPYPDRYDGALFFADYARRCIWMMPRGANGLPDTAAVEGFVTSAAGPVDLVFSPQGELYYPDLAGGTIRRIVYTGTVGPGGNSSNCPTGQFSVEYFNNLALSGTPAASGCETPPIDHEWGPGAPAAGVQVDGFSARWDGNINFATTDTYRFTASTDDGVKLYIDNELVLDEWRDQSAVFTVDRTLTAGVHRIMLEYYENAGGAMAKLSWAPTSANPGNDTPPVPTIATPTAALNWRVGQDIAFTGSATDAEDGPLPATALTWDLVLQHCTPTGCHAHPLQTWNGVATGSFAAPDHAYPSYLELKLTARDSANVTTTTTLRLDPQTVPITVATSPPGLQVSLGEQSGPSPLTAQVIVGGLISITAASPQNLAGNAYAFDSWSDAGGATHNVVAGTTGATYTATYAQTGSASCSAGQYVAEYYANLTLSGAPTLTRCESAPLNQNWGGAAPAPGLPVDGFSVRWSGTFDFPSAADHRFTATSDDGIRVSVDGTRIIDQWVNQPATTVGATRAMTAGSHAVVVEYYDAGGEAVAALSWAAVLPPPAPGITCATGSYAAEYFSNIAMSGTPVLSRCEVAPIDNDYGVGSPAAGIAVDGWSTRWTGTFAFATAGTYTFSATADDGVRVYVDGAVVIDQWKDQGPTTYTGTRSLAAGQHTVVVEYYENGGGAVARASWVLTTPQGGTNVAPEPTIVLPVAGATWKVGDPITFSGSATDPEDGTLAASALSWELVLQNCATTCVPQSLGTWNGVTGATTTAPMAQYPSYLELRLTARDAQDLTTTVTRRLDPQTVALTVASSPPGLQLTVGANTATAPFTTTMIVGSTATVNAPSPQVLAGSGYSFTGWSDSGAASHTVLAAATATTLTASYALAACPAGQYFAEYFSNLDLVGPATLSRCETSPLDHDFGAGAPAGLPVDNWSGRWTGTFDLATAGTYLFSATGDDGIRLSVDGTRLIDQWKNQPATTYGATRDLTTGAHTVMVEWFDSGGQAVVKASWSLSAPPPPPPTTCPTGQYTAQYFANMTLSGAAAVTRCETAPLANDWGAGSPAVGIPVDGFSTRWSGSFDFATAGAYTFTAIADDGVRVYVDGTILIDQWKDQGPTTYTGTRTLTAGTHTVVMEYYENGGGAVARLSWASTGAPPPPPPPTGCASGQFTAEYFANMTLAGAAAVTRCETAPLDNDWGAGAPVAGIPVDGFSVRWTGSFDFATAGAYVFSTTADDGVRVYVDGTILIDGWKDQGPTTYTGTRTLTAGAHTVVMEFYENGGGAVARLSWTSSTPPPPPPTSCPTGQFTAQYFTNTTFAGTAAVTRCETAPLDDDWGVGSPVAGVPADGFSVRWTGSFDFATAGAYVFSTTADDGVRVYVDGTILIDGWKDQGPTTYTGTRTLSAGTHVVVMEFYENGGGAVARLSWTPPVLALSASITTQSAIAASATADPTWCPSGRFLAAYYANVDLSGAPVRTECVAPDVSWRWGSGAPSGLPVDGFSVRLTGRVDVATTSTRRFTWAADDGVRVYLDGRRILDRWWAPSGGSLTRSLRAGTRLVQVEYVERTGDASLAFSLG